MDYLIRYPKRYFLQAFLWLDPVAATLTKNSPSPHYKECSSMLSVIVVVVIVVVIIIIIIIIIKFCFLPLLPLGTIFHMAPVPLEELPFLFLKPCI